MASRDERRERPPALPPKWQKARADGLRAIYPTDPAGGGTWISLTESGLSLCVLNGNPRPYPKLPSSDRLVTRGAIIPSLLGAGALTAPDAIAALDDLQLDRFAPFSIVAADLCADRPRVIRAAWNACQLAADTTSSAPFCAVSSGLGDHLVQPRLGLFDVLLAEHGVSAAAQDRFHRHAWPDRPEISVLMARADARTVSITTIEVLPATGDREARVRLAYQEVAEGVFHAPAGGRPRGIVSWPPIDSEGDTGLSRLT